ncbi:MAG TPA: DNA alkylation repair protein [Gemmatimonadaceae bacterium]
MPAPDERVVEMLRWLERRGTKRNRDGMARYGIVAPKVFGVSVADVRQQAKRLGRDHALALALWKTGWYEARMLAAFVDEPERVTPVQMDRWARAFDNWAITDTVCFHLFDRTPHAWAKIRQWSTRREEFVKRAAFALLASVALHDKRAPDAPFVRSLVIIERAASDPRNFVKKGVSWALRSVGRHSASLRAAAIELAERLSASSEPAARWVGHDALRDLNRLVKRGKKAKRSARRTATRSNVGGQ